MKNRLGFILACSVMAISSTCSGLKEGYGEPRKLIVKDVNVVKEVWESPAKSSYTAGTGMAMTGNESMTVYFNQYDGSVSDQFSNNKIFRAEGVALPSGNGMYTFSHTPISGAEKYDYYFLCPHHITTSSSRQARLFPLQFPEKDTFDPNYDFLIGKPVIGNAISESAVVNGFKRITAPVRILLEDQDGLLDGEDLMSLTVSFDGFSGRVTGFFSADLGDTYDAANITYWSQATVGNAVTALFPEGQKPSGKTYTVWLSVTPFQFNAGQKITFTATGRTRTVTGQIQTASSGEMSAEKLNSLKLVVTSLSRMTYSVFQDFSLCTSTADVPQAGDGKDYAWGFSGISPYKTAGKYGMHGGVTLKTNSSVLSLPEIEDKVIKSVRVYSHEETYASSSVTCVANIRSNGTLLSSKSINPYGGDVRNGGYVEFSGLEEKENLTLDVTSSDGSTSHIVPVSAIVLEVADAESYRKTVDCYDYPDGYRTSSIYTAKVNGENAHVFQTDEPHVLAFGCKEGEVAKVEISAAGGINSVKARPVAKNYDCTLSGGKVILNVKPYDRVVVEINGDTSSPLFVFVNPMDEFAPSASDRNVIYVGPGTVRSEDVILTSGQTLYIAGGGVLTGRVYAKRQSGVKVRGYGVVDGIEDSADSNRPVLFEYTDDITLNDCIVLNKTSWTVNMFECNDIVMDNCKIIATKNPATGNGHQNDGFSIIGSDRMKVTRGFSYSHDDAYSIKTSKWVYKGKGTDILYDDIICWNNTYGHGIELGTGLNEDLSGVIWRNCYILHSGGSSLPDVIGAIGICHAAGGTVSDVLYENIWIEDCRTRPAYIRIYQANSSENVGTGVVWSPGTIKNVTLRNINMDAASPVKGVIQGYDADHKVSLTIENMIIGGVKLTKDNYTAYFNSSQYSDVTIK